MLIKNSQPTKALVHSRHSSSRAAAALLTFLLLGFSANSYAGFINDMRKAITTIADGVDDMFSSAKNLTESLVGKIDTEVIANVTGRCTGVKAENSDGNTDTNNMTEHCAHSLVELRHIFADAGGKIIEQGEMVDRRLGEISKEAWEGASGAYSELIGKLLSFYGGAIFQPVTDLSNDLLTAMNDVKSILAELSVPIDQFSNENSLDINYATALGAGILEFALAGVVNNTFTENGADFIAADGELVVRLKSLSNLGFAPQAWAELTYINPIIKIEDDRITGLLAVQPRGKIVLSAIALPLQFSTSLDQLTGLPGLKNIKAFDKIADAISIDADIGTMALRVPLTDQSNSLFNFDLSVSGGIDIAANITGKWRIKVTERVNWTENIKLDIPALQLPLSSLPPGVVNAISSDFEPSNAELIVAYSFNESDSDIIEDTSGYGNHGRMVGEVALEHGAAQLNGIDSYIHLPDDVMENIDAITVYTEVYINQAQTGPYFIYGFGNSNEDWGDGYLATTGDIYRSTVSGCHWICEQSIFKDNVSVPRGSWQKLVYTLKENRATLYLNGDIVGQKTDMTLKPGDIGGGSTTANYIGRSLYKNDKYFDGAIRDFQIWHGALTHQEIIDKFSSH